jgi:hypothetical protein
MLGHDEIRLLRMLNYCNEIIATRERSMRQRVMKEMVILYGEQ